MKKIIFGWLILTMALLPVGIAKAGVNDFYFSDFTGDYYLSKDDEGISHLKVVEIVTAEFPEYKQNKGICRQIPFTNQDGANVTLASLTRQNLKLTRNGVEEPIYSIEKVNNYYNVCTGTEDYVTGTQAYTFEYEFTQVVTEFSTDGREYQELYWDTNGNGATQKFDKVTARLHFEDETVWTGESWCYVGKYGESGAERCTIEKIEDGVMFVAENLNSFENLTFDVELLADTFVVPLPMQNYILVIMMVVILVLAFGALAKPFRAFRIAIKKWRKYKGIFVAPQYQPDPRYDIAEMAEVYLGKKKDAKVSVLLEMVVQKKIEIKKEEQKKWVIVVKKWGEMGEEEKIVLKILNGGGGLADGSEIKIKSHEPSKTLVDLGQSFDREVLVKMRKKDLVEAGYKVSGGKLKGEGIGLANRGVMMLFVAFVLYYLGMKITKGEVNMEGYLVGKEVFGLVCFVIIWVVVLAYLLMRMQTERIVFHTLDGLDASKYMEGLKLYIKMAEAERMKILQSVEGADVTPEGIVKLYEKLLPYAAVFGLEKSWMNELKEYCKIQEIVEPDYLTTGIMVSTISRELYRATSRMPVSTTMYRSGGGFSSGSSGGGGGGFSGGGGGGGGFSGR